MLRYTVSKKGIKQFMKRFIFLTVILLMSSLLAAQSSSRISPENKVLPPPSSKIVNTKNLLSDIETLAADEMRGRGAGSPESFRAREFVEKRFKESGLKPLETSYLQEFPLRSRNNTEAGKATNVIGVIKGRKTPEKYIVITAHYDHVGVEDGEIYNGADDNASGTAALFALAEYFNKNQPAYSLMFVGFDAEERGLQGARYFVNNLPVKKESILLNINMDMISRSDKSELYAVGTFHYPLLKPHLEKIAKNSPVKLLLGHDRPELGRDDWTNQSDHAAFHQAKIPFIYFGVEDHADYHRPTDDFENIDQAFYVKAVETILSAVKEMDKNLK